MARKVLPTLLFLVFFFTILTSCDFDDSSKISVEIDNPRIDLRYKPLVYILPYSVADASGDYWTSNFGDRIHFYSQEDLTDHQDSISSDFSVISGVYNTVILFLPCDYENTLFLNNLKVMNDIAAVNNLSMIYNILPDVDYYAETTYLKEGTDSNIRLINLMNYLQPLSQTWKIPVWYGWDDHLDPHDIISFYSDLSEDLKSVYACWLDEEFIFDASMDSLDTLAGDSFMIVTEWYQAANMNDVSAKFENQMVVTGYEGAVGAEDYLNHIFDFIDPVRGENRTVGIWIFFDEGDGAGENYTGYFPDDNPSLPDIWNDYNVY